jgi:hypothetical protein
MEAGRSLILFLLAVAVCIAQGTESKKSASEFPVHAALGDADVAADFMVRLISYGRESFVTDNFLVVEVAIFPHAGRVFDVRANQFSLRVNGKKEVLFAQTPGMVIASVKYPDWETQSGGIGETGGGGVGIGGTAPVERFPGDPRARRIPRPGTGQDDTDAQAVKEPRLSPSEVITRSAISEGPRKTPVSGYLFFPWRGNPAKLKSVELTITDEKSGPVTLRLR